MLVDIGMGEFGPSHAVELPKVNGGSHVYGHSKLHLRPGQAARIFNTDETKVSCNATGTNRSFHLRSEKQVSTAIRTKGSQVHFTYVGLMTMPEYDRDELFTTDASGRQVWVPPAEFHHGCAWPGMVRPINVCV